jgi:cytochrome oxidase assembly protein ShyY1
LVGSIVSIIEPYPVPLRLTLWNRRLVANGWLALLTAAACVLFVVLGFWQWHRGEYRARLWEQFSQDSAAEPQDVTGQALSQPPRFTRLRVNGQLDPQHQFLLDNMTRNGRSGYEVLTPLLLADGSTLLVNRGWLPFSGYRDRLPDVGFDAAAAQTLTGRIEQLPTPGLSAGRAPPPTSGGWPRVTSYPTTAELGAALGRDVGPRMLLLDAGSGPGYLREWQAPGISPDRNFSYAIQWWAFAAIALALFFFLNLETRR